MKNFRNINKYLDINDSNFVFESNFFDFLNFHSLLILRSALGLGAAVSKKMMGKTVCWTAWTEGTKLANTSLISYENNKRSYKLSQSVWRS